MTSYDPPPPLDPLPDPGPEGPGVPGDERPRSEAEAIERIKARVVAQMDAFHIAIGDAERWARMAQKRVFVVRNGGRYHIADMADLRTYHRTDIHLKRADVVYMARS